MKIDSKIPKSFLFVDLTTTLTMHQIFTKKFSFRFPTQLLTQIIISIISNRISTYKSGLLAVFSLKVPLNGKRESLILSKMSEVSTSKNGL